MHWLSLMSKVQFTGHVYPKVMRVSVVSYRLDWTLTNRPVNAIIHISIQNSFVDVVCDIDNYSHATDFGELYNRVMDGVRCGVDLVAFKAGYGLTVLLENLIEDGAHSKLLCEDKSLPELCTAYGIGAMDIDGSFVSVLKRTMEEPPLFMALNDLILAITWPHHSTVNCARAIDGIRNMIAPGVDRSAGWRITRENLRIEESYLKLITKTSEPHRHGDRTYVDGSVTSEIGRRSWKIMNRFLEFRKRGNLPLPITEFPELR
jgi:hypothetical protein